MSRNQGETSLNRKRHRNNPMREYDQLPSELRNWLSSAMLPWRAKSVQRAFDKAMSQTGDAKQALRELGALQHRLIRKNAEKVWGEEYPI